MSSDCIIMVSTEIKEKNLLWSLTVMTHKIIVTSSHINTLENISYFAETQTILQEHLLVLMAPQTLFSICGEFFCGNTSNLFIAMHYRLCWNSLTLSALATYRHVHAPFNCRKVSRPLRAEVHQLTSNKRGGGSSPKQRKCDLKALLLN